MRVTKPIVKKLQNAVVTNVIAVFDSVKLNFF